MKIAICDIVDREEISATRGWANVNLQQSVPKSTLAKQLVLWHNGIVGGLASFIGIASDLKIGVVVLTNTVESVDRIRVETLSEMLRIKGHEFR